MERYLHFLECDVVAPLKGVKNGVKELGVGVIVPAPLIVVVACVLQGNLRVQVVGSKGWAA
eukprot:1886063-Ditylum_brightwellii.AAC.1